MDVIAATTFQCSLNSPFDGVPAPECVASFVPDDEDLRRLFIIAPPSLYWTRIGVPGRPAF